MKRIALLFLLAVSTLAQAQISSRLLSLCEEVIYNAQREPLYLRFKTQVQIPEAGADAYLRSLLFNSEDFSLKAFRRETDPEGWSHTRFHLYFKGHEVHNRVIVAHALNGRITSLNGELGQIALPANSFALSEAQALQFALAKVNALRYKWENKAEEAHMRSVLNQPAFTYYPKGQAVMTEKNGHSYFAYKFSIYAEEPLYKADVLVEASTGAILSEENRLCTVDVPASALTKYSGTQSITCDQSGAVYSLKETQRGGGVETYNLNNTANYGTATSLTNTSTNWTVTGVNQGGHDAHWGAEKTWDYYMYQHNRNSVDNNGFKLLSYIHYNTGYANAFWDGSRMTYGDGNGTSTYIFTTIDICGHEITHGVTENSSNLNYSNESGALNESFSDIFGTCIENYSRPSNWNWKMGEQMTANGNGIRNMANPAQFQDPDTYGGQYWYSGTADNGGVHTNSGVSNFWFYLLSQGGSGTNDLSNAYNVSGLGMNIAARIAFRALTVYFTPTTNYASARALSIQAAKDLYGMCSNEVIQTTNAWYAVGVGAAYIPGIIGANFVANKTNHCSVPANVNFSNTTVNGITYTWNFGDGSPAATSTNVSHTYTSNGTFNVKLKATGCNNGQDSILKTAYIVVNSPAIPTATGGLACSGGSATLSANGNNQVNWYAGSNSSVPLATGNVFVTPNLSVTTTYYVANTISNNPVFGGLLNPASGGGFLNNAAQWLIFDVFSNCTLNSVVMNAQSAGNRIVELRDASNNVINSFTAALAVGTNTVPLNFYLSPGANYQLGLANGSASSLYRTNTGVSFPYNIGGLVNLTSSSAGTGFYYWFYNWQVTESDCMSPLVAVTATALNGPQVSISNNNTLVCMNDEVSLSGQPAGGQFSGNGVTMNNTFIPPNSTGNYPVYYTYTDNFGCTGTDSITFSINECTGLLNQSAVKGGMQIFPNPASHWLMVSGHTSDLIHIRISDASGRVVLEKNLKTTERLDVSMLANGMYFVTCEGFDSESSTPFKLLKE